MEAFESASISLATWFKVPHMAIELEAKSRLLNQKAISMMSWKNMIDDVALVMDWTQSLGQRTSSVSSRPKNLLAAWNEFRHEDDATI